MSESAAPAASLRLDRWLWQARLYRTRALAQQAVSGGRVHVGGQRVRPSRALKVGEVVTLRRGDEELEVTVLRLGERRGPAPEAQTLYAESADSTARRAAAAEERRLAARAAPREGRRPDPRTRRLLRELRGRDD